jgi:hypothetical protein
MKTRKILMWKMAGKMARKMAGKMARKMAGQILSDSSIRGAL